MLEDKRLLRQVKKGNSLAFEAIYRKYKDMLFTVATGLLGDTAEAEDVLHDCFVRFAEGVSEFELNGSLGGYLCKCISNMCIDKLRRRKIYPIDDSESFQTTFQQGPAQMVIEQEQEDMLIDAIGTLSDDQKEVLFMHLHGKMKFREIADHKKVSINTVQSRYRYAIDKLKVILNGQV